MSKISNFLAVEKKTNGRPVLPLVIDENGEYCGYMLPFRDYGIDITETRDGECTLGTSGVHGLDSTIEAIAYTNHPFSHGNGKFCAVTAVKGFCWSAFMNFVKGAYGRDLKFADSIRELDKAFEELAKETVDFYLAQIGLMLPD